MYKLIDKEKHINDDGSIDEFCYGLFPNASNAEGLAEYLMQKHGFETEIVEVKASWKDVRKYVNSKHQMEVHREKVEAGTLNDEDRWPALHYDDQPEKTDEQLAALNFYETGNWDY